MLFTSENRGRPPNSEWDPRAVKLWQRRHLWDTVTFQCRIFYRDWTWSQAKGYFLKISTCNPTLNCQGLLTWLVWLSNKNAASRLYHTRLLLNAHGDLFFSKRSSHFFENKDFLLIWDKSYAGLRLCVCQTLLIWGKTTKQADHRRIHQQTRSVWGNRFQINHTSNAVKVVWEYTDFFGWYKWEVREKRRSERPRTNQRDLRLRRASIERCDRYRWGGAGRHRGEEERPSAVARRLNADFKVALHPQSISLLVSLNCLQQGGRRTNKTERPRCRKL